MGWREKRTLGRYDFLIDGKEKSFVPFLGQRIPALVPPECLLSNHFIILPFYLSETV
jgi:hypothetical protein